MSNPLFDPFRLVGGTNLSLRYGHRMSDDIDLFTDAEYRSLDYGVFEKFLESNFSYYYNSDDTSIVSFGRGYLVGNSPKEYVKIDLMYADPFINDAEVIDGVRLASVEDIIAMKMNVVLRGGRKKDFWDLHHLMNDYSVTQMLELHEKRHPWEHDGKILRKQMVDFSIADKLLDPHCLLNKDWDYIKLDIIDAVSK